MGKVLEETLRRIVPVSGRVIEEAWRHWDSRCKPLRGLGVFEELVVQLAGIQGTIFPSIEDRAVVIMGSDNGVVAEGVSQTGSEVTRQVLENMGEDITSVCLMGRCINARIVPINIGMNEPASHPKVRNLPVRCGTGNIRTGSAMSREDCVSAVETGIRVVRELKEQGTQLLLVGEMGIGNTTTSAACACALFGADAREMTGRGAGLSKEGVAHKAQVVRDALALNRPDPEDPLDILSKVGGLDIAGMTGCFLGAALCRIPALIDGVISGIAACFAAMLSPAAKDYMIATHATAEPAGERVMRFLDKRPVLFADMHLGEGTGAAMFLPMLDQALYLYRTLPSFGEGSVEEYKHL